MLPCKGGGGAFCRFYNFFAIWTTIYNLNFTHFTPIYKQLVFHTISYLSPLLPDTGPWVFALCANLAFTKFYIYKENLKK